MINQNIESLIQTQTPKTVTGINKFRLTIYSWLGLQIFGCSLEDMVEDLEQVQSTF